jgi:hypothetical protein
MSGERTVGLGLYLIYPQVAVVAGTDPSVGCAVTGKENYRGRLSQLLSESRSVLGFTDAQNLKALCSPLISRNGSNGIGEFTVIAGVHDVQMVVRHGLEHTDT